MKTSEKPKWKHILENIWLVIFKSVKVMKPGKGWEDITNFKAWFWSGSFCYTKCCWENWQNLNGIWGWYCGNVAIFISYVCWSYCDYVGEKKKWILIVAQSCPTLCDPEECSLSGSSVHGILQSRISEWVAIPFSKVSSWTRDQIQVSWIASRFFTIRVSKEAQHRRRSLYIGNIHSNIEYDGQHIDNFSEMHCSKETPLYVIYSFIFFLTASDCFKIKTITLKKD